MRNKNSAAVLAFFLGGVGVHKFYLGEIGWGIVYAVFFWTYIPSIAGFVEAVILLGMSEEAFNQKYNHRTLVGQQSKYLTNQAPPPQVVVNIGDPQSLAASSNLSRQNSSEQTKQLPAVDKKLSVEELDRHILKFCQSKGEMTFLDCFMEIDEVPKHLLRARLENLVMEEFLVVGNRESDGKVVYRLDN